MSRITSVDGIILWLLIRLVNYVAMLLVVCQLSRGVIGYEDSKCNWYVSIRLLLQLNSRLLLVKLSLLQSFSLYCCVVLLDLVKKSFLLCW